MKNMVGLIAAGIVAFLVSSCATERPYYKTSTGKKKQKYYNDIQFGRDPHPRKTF